ncbi:hypothetical protein BV394_02535 [Brevirhabdus pacifica]|uniref:Uncharacterized protein n=1 Tax=Brevirhabdus pacifica TaxID=1267768 RepID=A0A1U7DFH6_9RHOB|nr:hypothetical protein [Brevirhabdus pacifica]APX88747.1 hypothetical protein BV394_02535 [Brevirhabdus pacifica]OWU80003.1 hypothetical protein ATO5_03215 [Loktanella sp. 22II-4b]PJJ86732.1 hypothetical protein CLV77_1288 [Brevirhabdus pacifica]
MVDVTSSTHNAKPDSGFLGFFTSLFARRDAAFSFGILSGLTAHRIYKSLDAKSDAELARMGLKRTDIAQAAFTRAFPA